MSSVNNISSQKNKTKKSSNLKDKKVTNSNPNSDNKTFKQGKHSKSTHQKIKEDDNNHDFQDDFMSAENLKIAVLKEIALRIESGEKLHKRIIDDIAFTMGYSNGLVKFVFPRGIIDVIEYYLDQLIIDTEKELSKYSDVNRFSEKIEKIIYCRILCASKKKKIFHAVARFVICSSNKFAMLKLIYRDIDNILYISGDESNDWRFYSKRLTVGTIYYLCVGKWMRCDDIDKTEKFIKSSIKNFLFGIEKSKASSKLILKLVRKIPLFRLFLRFT